MQELLSVNTVGLVAGLLTTVSLIPQIWKIYQTRGAKDISLGMYITYSLGVLAWFIYGILLHDFPLMLWNGTGLALAVVVIAMKLIFDKRPA